jgi:hypothetical protein
MRTLRAVVGLAVLLVPIAGVNAQEAAPPDAPKLRQALKDALALLRKKEPEPPPSDRFSFIHEDPPVDLLNRIAKAQALLGDQAGAAATWQEAIDGVNATQFFLAQNTRAEMLLEIGVAQGESGSEDAPTTLTQAAQAARVIKEDELGVPDPPFFGVGAEAAATRAEVLARIAAAQAKAREGASARKTMSQAAEAVEEVKDSLQKVGALAVIAMCQDAGAARDSWEKATHLALELRDEGPRARAVEAILRARLVAGQHDEAVRLVAERLEGDARAHAVWILAGNLAKAETPFPSAVVDRLLEVADKLKFDDEQKKIKIYTSLAEAKARLGDGEGAGRILDQIQPGEGWHRMRYDQVRVGLLRDVAKAQLGMEARDAARDTLQVAWEILAPYVEGGAIEWFPVPEIAEMRARAGDVRGARQSVAGILNAHGRVTVLTAIAAAQAAEGDREAARQDIAAAELAAALLTNETLWAEDDVMPRFTFGRDDRLLPKLVRPFDTSGKHQVQQQIAIARARTGDLAAAREAADAMLKEDGDGAATEVLGEIARIQARSGDFAAAFTTLEDLPPGIHHGNAKDVVQELATAQAKTGDVQPILDRAAKRISVLTRPRLLRGLADGISARAASAKL